MYKNVKAELARRDMSLNDLSTMTGISYSTLHNKMNGKTALTLDEALKIKTALDIELPIEELFEVSV